jgi:hypothetical protein
MLLGASLMAEYFCYGLLLNTTVAMHNGIIQPVNTFHENVQHWLFTAKILTQNLVILAFGNKYTRLDKRKPSKIFVT